MITKEEFENIATLSRLSKEEEDYNRFCEELSRMIEFADGIKEVSLEDEVSFCTDRHKTALRDDKAGVSSDRQEILSNAPCSQDGFFLLRKRA